MRIAPTDGCNFDSEHVQIQVSLTFLLSPKPTKSVSRGAPWSAQRPRCAFECLPHAEGGDGR